MSLVHVAVGAVNQTPLAWQQNRDNILSVLDEARRLGASVLCLPELCITGYGCEDAFLAEETRLTALDIVQQVAEHTSDITVCVGLPVKFGDAHYSASCLLCDGKILGFVAKQFLAREGIHYEPRWFHPWPRGCVGELSVGGARYPLGDLYFDCDGIRLGFEICEDAWVADRPLAGLASQGIDIVLNPSASHFSLGKQQARRWLVVESSRSFGVSYLYANLLGNEAGRAIYAGELLIADGGEIVSEASRFSFAPYRLALASLDLERNRLQRAAKFKDVSPRPAAARAIATANQVSSDFCRTSDRQVVGVSAPAQWEHSDFTRFEEFTRAVALGLFDYLRKTGMQGFVVSLSGGADSAAVACLVSLMVRVGVSELGERGFIRRLGKIDFGSEHDEPALVKRLLTTVYQATRNSSHTTRAAARTVALAIGAEHVEQDIDDLVVGYTRRAEEALGRTLDWQHDDLALQNVQARARAPGVWLIANVKRALLLTTSNRSEAAVGYATMDGDTAGGLGPLAGIDKAFLLSWLAWLEHHGPMGLGPITELESITSQEPTAELRPSAAQQTDEADLMPYEVLDAIEHAAIVDRLSPIKAYHCLRERFSEYGSAQLLIWVKRFFLLWARNQWKRERYAPSFHLDDANLDPKTWCRFPILSGGYDWELERLEQLVKEELAQPTKLS